MEGIVIRTCLKLQMLCHYYAIARPYAWNDKDHARSTAVAEQRQELIDEDMLVPVPGERGYDVTEKARCYLNYIFNSLGYPKPDWSMD